MDAQLVNISYPDIWWTLTTMDTQGWPELEDKMRKTLNRTEFHTNPVAYITDWKKRHPQETMEGYGRLRGKSTGGHHQQTDKEVAVTELARAAMLSPKYVERFCETLLARSDEILASVFTDTHPDIVAVIKQTFKERLEDPKFHEELALVRDRMAGDDHSSERAKLTDLDALTYDFNFPGLTKNVQLDQTRQLLTELVKRHFILVANPASFG